MTEIFTKIYNELWGTDTSLLIWTLFGFLVIVFISRRIGKLRELKNREKLLLTIDTILFPIMIVLFHFISSAISPESNIYSISIFFKSIGCPPTDSCVLLFKSMYFTKSIRLSIHIKYSVMFMDFKFVY